MKAHTLGEVGNLSTVSLRVSSGTILPIFIEIGSYLTEKEQKISWHSFFETRCTFLNHSLFVLVFLPFVKVAFKKLVAVVCATKMTFDYQYIDPGPDDPGCTKNRYFALNVSSLCVKRLAQSKFYILVNERETIKPGFHINYACKLWFMWWMKILRAAT